MPRALPWSAPLTRPVPRQGVVPRRAGRRPRPRLLRSMILTGGALLIVLCATGILITDSAPARLDPDTAIDQLVYSVHAHLGATLPIVGAHPTTVALQWVKAAAHARSEQEVRRASVGIAASRRQTDRLATLDLALCAVAALGAPTVQVAVALAETACLQDYFVRSHVSIGAGIDYGLVHPPIGGPHYEASYPIYSLVEAPIPAGYWLHNLEHGAIVLLYRCPDDCPVLLDQIRGLSAVLPPNRNAGDVGPRLLATPYHAMEHRLAVLAWGRLLELDHFDQEQILTFYLAHVDRGPECRALRCPF